MSVENLFGSGKTLWVSVGGIAIALITAMLYTAVQLADVKESNKRLLQEFNTVQELLEQRIAFQASLQHAESGAPDASSASELTDIIRSELKPITQSIARLNAADSRTAVQGPQAPPGMPALPMVGMPNLPRPGIGETTPGSALPFSSNLPKETRSYVDSVFRANAEEARRRISEEMDPQHMDPTVIRRIMEESREDLMSQLQGVLPQEDFEALFPAFPAPGAGVGQGNMVHRGQTPTQE